jgi:hypothetical protein
MGDFENLLPMPDSMKTLLKEAFKAMNGDVLFSIRMDTAGIHPILVMPTQQKATVEKTFKQMLVNKQLTIDSMGVYTVVKKVDTLKTLFPNVAPPSETVQKPTPAPVPTENVDNHKDTEGNLTVRDSSEMPKIDSLDDNTMPPPSADMPSPNPLKGKGGFKMNRWLWQNDMLIMTDSISIAIMRKTVDKPRLATESTKALAQSAFGFHLNLDAALNSGYPGVMLIRMMIPDLPMSNLHLTFEEKGTNTIITTAKNNENILMTWLGFVNQMGSLLGGLFKDKGAPVEPQQDDEKK